MTSVKVVLLALLATSLVFSAAPRAWAQDPAVVNADTIKVKLENDRVRVLEAVIAPGTREQVHSHPAYVIYVIAGGKMRNYATDGKVTETTLHTGEVLFREPLTHSAENIGDTTLRLELVELKSAVAPKPSSGH